MKEIIEKLKHRVESYVNSSTDECIEYPKVGNDGYGCIQNKNDGKNIHVRVHRLVYQIANNCVLNRDELVLHKCDNPPCCNPRHLFVGTNQDNIDDMVSKGRQAKGRKNGQYKTGYESKYDPVERPKTPFEQLHGRSLTVDQVVFIKNEIKKGNYANLKVLSSDIGVKYQTIKDIYYGRAYQSITI